MRNQSLQDGKVFSVPSLHLSKSLTELAPQGPAPFFCGNLVLETLRMLNKCSSTEPRPQPPDTSPCLFQDLVNFRNPRYETVLYSISSTVEETW